MIDEDNEALGLAAVRLERAQALRSIAVRDFGRLDRGPGSPFAWPVLMPSELVDPLPGKTPSIHVDDRAAPGPEQAREDLGQTTATLGVLVGSGDKIGLLTLPFLVVGTALNLLHPSWFSVGGPPRALLVISLVILVPGISNWFWCVVLILRRVPRGELITDGPYAVVKHPLYTGVALLVLPWAGFLLDTWLGALLGVVLYLGSRLYAPAEERAMSVKFGARWESYLTRVKLPWL